MIRFFSLFLRDKNDKTEFDFDKDKYDIRIPEDLDETGKRGYKKQIKKRCCPAVPDTCLDKTLKITELLTVSLPYFIICINCSASEREKVKTHIGHPLLDFFCLCGCFVCFPTGILQHLMRTYGLF